MAVGGYATMLAAPGRERPDYTVFDFPAATVVDGATEEVEIDQALSLQGRRGRDFLGAMVRGLVGIMRTEHLTISTADHEMVVLIGLNSRTGAFSLEDPEHLWEHSISQAVTAPTTATSEAFNPVIEEFPLGEPELYVAPRLFWRLNNSLDASITAGQMEAKMSSVSRRLTFELFIELLERYADVTLL